MAQLLFSRLSSAESDFSSWEVALLQAVMNDSIIMKHNDTFMLLYALFVFCLLNHLQQLYLELQG